jgi:hypothetical protein
MSQVNCLLDTGIGRICKENTPGVQEIYLANYDSDVTYTTDANNVITGYTGTVEWYKFEFPRNTASFTETLAGVPENDEVTYQEMVSMVFNKRDAQKRNLMLLLAKATTVAIVKDKNGLYTLVGKESGLDLSTGTNGTGAAPGERNGYSFEFSGTEGDAAPFITFAAFSADIETAQI